MFPIKPLGLHSAQEELRAICVGSSIGHGQDTWASVTQREVFVGKFHPIDRLATGSITSSEVTTLTHEVWDDTMEGGALVAESPFSCTQSTEVLCSLGNYISTQLHNNSANRLVVRNDIEEDLWIPHGEDFTTF
eukprot:GEMP01088620.1.p2 GENE.GEMP01088620.1~~GEMP01088620.1.p2  ORF type:complete len:134 (-),score=18.65 GEMP01088620.1:30-431(-)